MKVEYFGWKDLSFQTCNHRFEFRQQIERLIRAINENAYEDIQEFVAREGAFDWETAPPIHDALKKRMQLNAANGVRIDPGAFFKLIPGSFRIATGVIQELVVRSCFPQARIFSEFHHLYEWYKFECQSALQNAVNFTRNDGPQRFGLFDQHKVSVVLTESGIDASDLVHARYRQTVLKPLEPLLQLG